MLIKVNRNEVKSKQVTQMLKIEQDLRNIEYSVSKEF